MFYRVSISWILGRALLGALFCKYVFLSSLTIGLDWGLFVEGIKVKSLKVGILYNEQCCKFLQYLEGFFAPLCFHNMIFFQVYVFIFLVCPQFLSQLCFQA